MRWYAASVIVYTQLKDGVQDHYPVWENIVLIKAESEEEAYEKAVKIGQEQEGDSEGTYRYHGRPARWVFAGVREVLRCENDDERPDDGTEVYYSEYSVDTADNLRRLAEGRSVKLWYEEMAPRISGLDASRKAGVVPMLTIGVEQEEDGRWLAEVPALPGVLTYGQTRQEAIERAQVFSLRVLADRLEHGESVPGMGSVFEVVP